MYSLLNQSDCWSESPSDYYDYDWYEKPETKEVLCEYYYDLFKTLIHEGYMDYSDLDELWEQSNQDYDAYKSLLEKAIDDAEETYREETAD